MRFMEMQSKIIDQKHIQNHMVWLLVGIHIFAHATRGAR